YRIQGPLKFQGVLHKHEPDYYLHGHLNWRIEQECSRCAENFSSSIKHDFQLALAHRAAHQTDDNDDLDLVFFEGNELDLKPVLHEQFLLSLPFKALCQDACKGLCQHCGKNLNRQECACANIPKGNPFSVLKTVTL
ncbi:MAG: YceD family protein, partial [Pseudomonadota bacterium]